MQQREIPDWGGGSRYSQSCSLSQTEGAESGQTADAATVWKRTGDVDALEALPVLSSWEWTPRGWAPMSEEPALLAPLPPKPRQSRET